MKPCEKLIRDLNLSPGESYTQDWVWEVSDFKRIESFLIYYQETILNFEEKRALINIILDSYEEYAGVNGYNLNYSRQIKQILEEENEIFEDVIQYWSREGEELEYCFLITPLVRSVRAKESLN
jgi:hypothetical protein